MNYDDILLLKGDRIIELFQGRDLEILAAVKSAYQTHAKGDSSLPHSNFLRFPNNDKDRIIALPAYLGGSANIAGLKWIASFPGNLDLGMERASAVLILNSAQTGHAQAILESSTISAKRTAASAALAAKYLRGDRSLDTVNTVGTIGTGLINFETVRFLLATHPALKTLLIYDLNQERAEQFQRKCYELSTTLEVIIVTEPRSIFQSASVIALATTASKPHITDLSECRSDCIILHTSLRDLSPEIILSADNIVDDIDHVSRAETSIHLAEKQVGNRNFIRGTIGEVFNGIIPPQIDNHKLQIFSPFGLGILDLALGQLACKLAKEQQQGTVIESFLPSSWLDRKEPQAVSR
jgi:N-[(2S)-2-amino-2-carboxyethyl]-L-glutamate dehydrogenase